MDTSNVWGQSWKRGGLEAEIKQRECSVEKLQELQWNVVRQEDASDVEEEE